VTEATVDSRSELDELALGKLTRVLGESGGQRVFDETLADVGLTKIGSANDLYVFAGALTRRSGFEGAVGGLLSVAAVMRGASPARETT
jgi:hypothetical protein